MMILAISSQVEDSKIHLLNLKKLISDNHVRYLIQIVDPDTGDIQLSELVLQSSTLNTYPVLKSILLSVIVYLEISVQDLDDTGRKTLIFDPTDPFDTDHDIKILRKNIFINGSLQVLLELEQSPLVV